MKLTLLLVGLVVLALVHDSEAGWFRRTIRRIGRGIRRVVRKIRPVACLVCPRVCRTPIACGIACRAVCRGKRDVAQEIEGHVTPLANQFAAYDLNDDGVISRKELAVAVGEDEAHHDFIKAYSVADVDGDMILSPKEFYNGPFVFEMDLDDDDLSYCRYRLDVDDDLLDIEDNLDEDAPNYINGVQVKDTGKPHKLSVKAIDGKRSEYIGKATKISDKYIKDNQGKIIPSLI